MGCNATCSPGCPGNEVGIHIPAKTSAQSLAAAINAQKAGEAFNGMTAEEIVESVVNFCIEEVNTQDWERYCGADPAHALRIVRDDPKTTLKHIATGEYRNSTYAPGRLP
jgi:hypothetical protein